MSDFQDQLNARYIEPIKFITAWEKHLFGGQLLPLLPEKERVATLQRIRAQAQQLWNHFNGPERSVPKHYMDDARFLNAYLGAFFLPNIQRLFSIFSERTAQSTLARMASTVRDEFHIIDFGAGPLSASIAALFAATHWGLSDRVTIRLTIIERSEKAFQAGKAILQAAITPSTTLEITRAPSLDKVEGVAHLVLAANVINELPEAHQLTTVRKLIEKTTTGGVLLVVEPGQDVHARRLGALRDAILSETPTLQIISPCLHAQPCPLSSASSRSDWCWFRAGWNRPKALRDIDFYTRLRHDELAFSFLCLQNSGLPMMLRDELYARVVSDPVSLGASDKQKNSALVWARANLVAGMADALASIETGGVAPRKSLLCTREGGLEGALTLNENQVLERGSTVTEPEVPLRCKERVSLSTPKKA
jgi:ribosomal protein RSM22 (predicted rRNA methylase)